MVLIDKNKVIKELKKYLDEDYLDGYELWNDIESLPVCEDAISKRALINEILEDGNGAVLSYPAGMYEDELVEHIKRQMIEYFIGVINYMPLIERERPKGEWIKRSSVGNWECSLCGNGIIVSEHNLANYNFCPNCGADMKGATKCTK